MNQSKAIGAILLALAAVGAWYVFEQWKLKQAISKDIDNSGILDTPGTTTAGAWVGQPEAFHTLHATTARADDSVSRLAPAIVGNYNRNLRDIDGVAAPVNYGALG